MSAGGCLLPPCPSCGAGIDMQVAGVCAPCAFGLAQPKSAPELIGPYRVVSELGRGGMGIVYRVCEPWSGREVALKMLRGGALADDRDRASFRGDLTFLSRLQHPNIVQVHDTSGVHDGAAYFTMQLVDGGSLEAAHVKARFGEPKAAAQLVATLAHAVQFCHAATTPVLHRDIKPANILIGGERHPYLTDFGIAKGLEGPHSMHTQTRVGTVPYMSPEQVSGRGLKPASDVYSLGVVLYELLTGRLPHEADTEAELMRRIEHEPIVPPRRHKPKLSRDLDAVCMAALAPRPAQRYQTAAALAADLERYLRGEPPRLVARAKLLRIYRELRHSARLRRTALLLTVPLFVAASLALCHALAQARVEDAIKALKFMTPKQAMALANDLRVEAQVVSSTARQFEQETLASQRSASVATSVASNSASFLYPLEFDVIMHYDRDGVALMRTPNIGGNVIGRNFAFRDYYKSALAMARAGRRDATTALTHHSEADSTYEFPITAPLFDSQGRFDGLLLGLMRTREWFRESNKAATKSKRGYVTSVIGLRDVNRNEPPHEHPEYTLIVHPKRSRGKAEPISAALSKRLQRAFGGAAPPAQRLLDAALVGDEASLVLADYEDVADKQSRPERWIIAFSPVARTGFVVAIQIRHSEIIGALGQIQERLRALGLPGACAALGVWFVLMLHYVHKARVTVSR